MAPPVADSTKTEEKKLSPRRINKPLIEKRRRARINDCLAQLKSIVLEASDTQSPRPSKLEKADILEMTVDFIKRNSKPSEDKSDQKTDGQNTGTEYMAGYTGCLAEITQFLEETRHENTSLKTDIIAHVSNKMNDRCLNVRQACQTQQNKAENKPAPKMTSETKPEVKCANETTAKSTTAHDPIKPSIPQPCSATSTQTRSTTGQTAAPVGILCGGQVLLLLQLPTSQAMVTSQTLAPPSTVLPAPGTSLPFIPTFAASTNLNEIPNYIKELNLARPVNSAMFSTPSSSSIADTSLPKVLDMTSLKHTGTQPSVLSLTGLPVVSQNNGVCNQNNVIQPTSPWRPW